MLYKLNKKGVNKIFDIVTKTQNGEKLFIEIQCNINNLLLHKAQLLRRDKYISWFKHNLLKLGSIAKQDSGFFDKSDFDCSENFYLNGAGKEKLRDRNLSTEDFSNRCLIVESAYKQCFFKTFDKDFKLNLYEAEFEFNDFY